MEFGCNPNAYTQKWPALRSWRYPFSSQDDNAELKWCRRTTWQAWLGEAYLQIQRRVSVAMPGQIGKTVDMQKQWLGELVDLLLRHGADPRCTICNTDHEDEPADSRETSCSHVALDRLLEQIVPAESIVRLQDLRKECSDGTISHVLRRNQQKRAIRSLLISEQNSAMIDTQEERGLRWKHFLEALTDVAELTDSVCNRYSMGVEAALATWCVECQGLSSLCLNCSLLRPSEVPGLIFPCDNFTIPCCSRNGDHTSVVFVWEDWPLRAGDYLFRGRDNQTMENHADILQVQFPTDRAIAILKGWYAKDPIEPDLTFEEAIRGIAISPPPSGHHQTSGDDATGGSAASVHPINASKRSRIGIEDSEVASKRHTAVHRPTATRRGSQEGSASENQAEASILDHEVRGGVVVGLLIDR